ncbi:MAG TPA: hypothetical protein VFP10_06775 [Candidatus Eisenbacteria bacterium]|nr:hypothetical protein [Candidatus Eisenbacteria bacterium]
MNKPPSVPVGRWVHVFEEDGEDGEVYRPAESDIPLSRRPREQLELHENGTATVSTGGPDDRPIGRPAAWSREAGHIVVRVTHPSQKSEAWRLIVQSPQRIVIRRGSDGGKSEG